MSGKIMGQVWDLELPHNKLIVLLAMADHAHHDGTNVYPSVGLIAWKTGYSDRSVRRIINQLVDDGILICVESKPGMVKKYTIDLSKGVQKEPYKSEETPDKMSEVENDTPDTAMSPHPRHSYVTPTPDTAMSPKPSIKPSGEPIGDKSQDEKIIPLEQTKEPKPQEQLGIAFGTPPVTKQDWSLYGKVCKQLDEAGIEPSQYPDYISWVRNLAKTSGAWKVTIPSLISGGRVSDYVATKAAMENVPTSNSQQLEREAGEAAMYKLLIGDSA